MNDTEDRFLTYREIADLAGVQLNTAYMWGKRGLLPAPDQRVGRVPKWKQSTITDFLIHSARGHMVPGYYDDQE